MLRRVLTASALLAVVAVSPAPAANIVINNLNDPGVGFNDTTPATPVGGNQGITVGDQRLRVFEEAARIWGGLLPSGGPTITVDATFEEQFCDASSATLGSAGPIQVFRDFDQAEYGATWYHVALAQQLAGVELGGTTNEIRARFNSLLDGRANCLGGAEWYYGFDGNEPVGTIELLPVVLHEIGHGLGFSSFVDNSTGENFQGFNDIFSRFLFDEDQNRSWSSMSNGQRATSAITPQEVVWNGNEVGRLAAGFLASPPLLDVTDPPALAGTEFAIGTASFGPPVDAGVIQGVVIEVNDGSGLSSTDGCEAAANGAALNGNIALMDRGNCPFVQKALNAQDAGANAVIIVNNLPGDGPMQMGGSDPSVTIPVISVSLEQGDLIKAQLANGVFARITTDPQLLAGASPTSLQPYIYTPNPVQPGSSVSHWDTSASPNLLMEPAINSDLSSAVDLTLFAFLDQGWQVVVGTGDTPAKAPARLVGNAPNPFNPKTTISFEIARAGDVELSVYDAAGRKVRTLVRGALGAGPHDIAWNGTDDAGQQVASGVYRARLKANGVDLSRPMVLLK